MNTLPPELYVWIVSQDGEDRIRKWDIKPFEEATHICVQPSTIQSPDQRSETTQLGAVEDVRFIRKELGRTWINQRQREVRFQKGRIVFIPPEYPRDISLKDLRQRVKEKYGKKKSVVGKHDSMIVIFRGETQ